MDKAQITRYFNRLYPADSRFELLFTHPDNKRTARVERVWGEEDDRVLDDIRRAEDAGYNVYASTMPLEVQALGRYDRVWVDQDDPAAPYPFGSDPDAPAWPEPTTLVRTSEAEGGFRWQAIWRLQHPKDDARQMMKRLAGQIGADSGVHDPRRVFRVPGVMNAKRGSQARLLSTNPEPVSEQAFNLPDQTFADKLLETEVVAPQHVLGEWLEGVDEGDRSRKAYVAARFLKSCQVGFEDAASILKVGAVRCNPPFSDRELLHTVESAYHRV